ncbi:GTPase Era [Frankliniella fusca]|uniref:GTPase Era n=1 Tax=Frankliniella fusca TaxID=407009 RepID=A0AAE1LU05_9NEOP|nr:GTPase Era [Frankliniella fusca]
MENEPIEDERMEDQPDQVQQSPCLQHCREQLLQCDALCNIRKSIVASCQKAEEATIDDFKALLDDGEIFNLTELEGSNCDYHVFTDSILNSTTASNESETGNTIQAVNKPFVPFSVEEVSLVRTLACWSNHNVRVIGKISPSLNGFTNIWLLSSIGEEGGPFTIKVDLKLLKEFPADNSSVQVFGEMQFSSDSSPLILAKFFRDFSSVDLFYFNKGLEEVKKFVPHFITELSQ